MGVFELPVHQFNNTRLHAVQSYLSEELEYSYVSLNEILPQDRQLWYSTVGMLKKNGLHFPTTLYTYSTGGVHGNFYFAWKTDDRGKEVDKTATMAATISAKIVADIPKHHTRQMRESREKFHMVAKVKPAIMQEMYCQFTHDASSASCQTTAEVDERIRQLLISRTQTLCTT